MLRLRLIWRSAWAIKCSGILLSTKPGVRPLANGLVPSPENADFLRSSFRISCYEATPQTYMTRSVTVSSILEQTDPTSEIRNPVDLGVITVPLYGNVISYPFDGYSAAGDWQVFPPPGTAISNSEGIRLSWTPPVVVAATPDSDNLAWRTSSPQSSSHAIEASRIPFVKFFVCLIAGLPLLLFAGLLALVWPLANDPERRRFPAELLVVVGAFLLADLGDCGHVGGVVQPPVPALMRCVEITDRLHVGTSDGFTA